MNVILNLDNGESHDLPQEGFISFAFVAEYCANATPLRCMVLYDAIKGLMFNPVGLAVNITSFEEIGERKFRQPALRQVSHAEMLNFEFICSNDNNYHMDCLLLHDFRLQARGLFGSFPIPQLLAMKQVCFIHSVLLPGLVPDILEEIINTVLHSTLIFDQIFVIHYGIPLSSEFTKKYSNIQFVYYSSDVARFEIPTLQLMHYFSKLLLELRKHYKLWSVGYKESGEYRILYLHTKGVSYNNSQASNDWRRMMLYFLVERGDHAISYFNNTNSTDSLVDTIGVNLKIGMDYLVNGELMYGNFGACYYYMGNYWWARTDYIAALPRLSVTRNNKYDAEFWLGSGKDPSMVSVHNSNIMHNVEVYPKYLYVVNDTV